MDRREGAFKIWLAKNVWPFPHNQVQMLWSRIQGDAGEVDFVRKNGMEAYEVVFLTKTDYATDVAGNITNNVPRIDVIERTRILGA